MSERFSVGQEVYVFNYTFGYSKGAIIDKDGIFYNVQLDCGEKFLMREDNIYSNDSINALRDKLQLHCNFLNRTLEYLKDEMEGSENE